MQFSRPGRRVNIYYPGWVATCILGTMVFVTIMLLHPSDLLHTLAASTGAFLSTLIAFRWFWSRRYGWESYFITIRPLYQTMAFAFVILGPLGPLAGLPQFLCNRDCLGYYWLLYLMSPIAFLLYEIGYELGLGHASYKLHLPHTQELQNAAPRIMVAMFAVVMVIYLYWSWTYGLGQAGLQDVGVLDDPSTATSTKAIFMLYNGFLAIALAAAVVSYNREGIENKIISLLVIFSIFALVLTLQNRSRAMVMVLVMLAAYQLVRKRNFLKIVIIGIIAMPLTYYIVTGIRDSLTPEVMESGVSVVERFKGAADNLKEQALKPAVEAHLKIDVGYRLDAFDEPAAILKSRDHNHIAYMYGREFYEGAYGVVPAVLAPSPKLDAERIIIEHFDLEDFDQNSTMFGTAIADFGIFSLALFTALVGFFNAYLWRIIATGTFTGVRFALFGLISGLIKYNEMIGSYIPLNVRNGLLYVIICWALLKMVEIIIGKQAGARGSGIRPVRA